MIYVGKKEIKRMVDQIEGAAVVLEPGTPERLMLLGELRLLQRLFPQYVEMADCFRREMDHANEIRN